MQLRNQNGNTIIGVLVAVAIMCIVGASSAGYLAAYRSGIMAAKTAGAVADLDAFLRRHTDCKRTIRTNYALCQNTSFVPVTTTWSASCGAFSTGSSEIRTDLDKTYDVKNFQVACRKVSGDRYQISAQYRTKGDGTMELFLPPMQCDVTVMPPTKTFVSGWDARSWVVNNFQPSLPWNDDAGHPSGSFWVRPETIAAVCRTAGYAYYAGLPPSSDYSSCGNNSAFSWNPSTQKFNVENACMKNGQLWHDGAVTCINPIGGVEPCQ